MRGVDPPRALAPYIVDEAPPLGADESASEPTTPAPPAPSMPSFAEAAHHAEVAQGGGAQEQQPDDAQEQQQGDEGDGRHCPAGHYRVDAIVWECGQTKNSGVFQLPAGQAQVAITIPSGVSDFGFKTTSSAAVTLAVVDMATRITALRGGAQQQATQEYQGMTITYSRVHDGLDGERCVASIWIEGTVRSPLSVQVISSEEAGGPVTEVGMDYLYARITPCPAEPVGCKAYDVAQATAATHKWGCAVKSKVGSDAGAAWEQLAAQPTTGEVAWFEWPTVWTRSGVGGAEEDWKLSFAFMDKDRDSVVSQAEFKSGFGLCTEDVAAPPPAGPQAETHTIPGAMPELQASPGSHSSGLVAILQVILGVLVLAAMAGIACWYLKDSDKCGSRGRAQNRSKVVNDDPFHTHHAQGDARAFKVDTSESAYERRAPPPVDPQLHKMHPAPILEKEPAHTGYTPLPSRDAGPTATAYLAPPVVEKDENRNCMATSWSSFLSCAGFRGSAKHAWDCSNCGHKMLVQTTTCSKCGQPRTRPLSTTSSNPPGHAEFQERIVSQPYSHHTADFGERDALLSPLERPHPPPQHHDAAVTRNVEDAFMQHGPPNPPLATQPSQHEDVAHIAEQHHGHAEAQHHRQHETDTLPLVGHGHGRAQPHHEPQHEPNHEAHHEAPNVHQQPAQAQQLTHSGEHAEDTVLGVVESMHRGMADVSLVTKSCKYLADVAQDSGGKEETMRCGADDAVLRAMEKHPDNLELNLEACSALRNFVLEREDFADRIADRHGVETVLRVMRVNMGSPELVEKACWVLQQLSLSEAGRASIASDHGTRLIVEGMNQHRTTPGVQESSSLTIGNLAFDEPLRDQIAESKGVAAIVQSMRSHSADAGVQEAGVFALHNIACSQELVHQIAAAGGKGILHDAIRNHPDIEEREEAQATIDMLEYMQQEELEARGGHGGHG